MESGSVKLLTGGKLVNTETIACRDILIAGEQVLKLGNPRIEPPANCRIIDCSGKLIFPGIIDAHVHLKNAVAESRLALRGAVTTIVDSGNPRPGMSCSDSIRQRKAELAGCHVDFSLACTLSGVEDGVLEQLPVLADEGITCFKVSTTETAGCAMLPYPEIEQLARGLAKVGAVLRAHAEDDLVIKQATEHLIARKRTAPAYFGLSRPAIAEIDRKSVV